MQTVPSGLEVPLQAPALHTPLPHSPLPLPVQSAQAWPALPQAVSKVPIRHWVPLQHPLQPLVLQAPPQPSGAPGHLPLHCVGQGASGV